MRKDTALQFQFDCHDVDWTALEVLFQAGKLGGRKGEKVRRAFENSQVVCFVTDDRLLVGAGRAITDGEYHGVIYDIVVHPDYQRQGTGARLMKELIGRLPVWRILLVADVDVQPFYMKLGFQPFSGAMARFDKSKLYDVTPGGSGVWANGSAAASSDVT